ncbi:unnamed protein product [Hydatigera taeniaeformis]|uniref:Proteasome assembly chaperone 1 n=1 Tax=Hydatigena taeniaeformis TaxID=6205 RepID=A0A0R3X2J5_HYDTA|nr:unnamed protein product [Hydatigera taeniaeformis]
MATLFPKKVPAFTRALGGNDDIFDSETDLPVEAEVAVTFSVNFNQRISVLVFGIGAAQCEVLSANIDFSKAVKMRVVDLTVSNQIVMSCSAFMFDQKIVIWLCDTQERDSCYGFRKWVDTLLSSFLLDQNSCIYILTDSPASEFQSDFKPSTPFIRTLRTPRASGLCFPDVKPLEPPNIIAGFASPIMAHCIYHSLPACVLIVYYENLRTSLAKTDIFPVLIPILAAIGELRPFILSDGISGRPTAHNFDQMYI